MTFADKLRFITVNLLDDDNYDESITEEPECKNCRVDDKSDADNQLTSTSLVSFIFARTTISRWKRHSGFIVVSQFAKTSAMKYDVTSVYFSRWRIAHESIGKLR